MEYKKSKALYEKKRLIKKVSFNTEVDADLLSVVAAIPDFSNWVKDQLRKEVNQNVCNSQPKDTQ